MTDRITADILVEAFDLALPDFDDLKDRIEEAAAAHKATLTVDGRRYPAAATPVPPPADRAAVRALTQAERDMLRYALDLTQEQMLCVGDEFSDADHAAVDSLRRLAAEAPPACAECGHPHAAHREGDDPVTPGTCSACSDDDDRHDYVAAAGAQPTTKPETEAVCVCGHPTRLHHEDACLQCSCGDCLETSALPEALEAVLTKRFTELGNQFAEMRVHEQGPDGWPSSRLVSPHMVAEALRELLRRGTDDEPGLRLPDHTVNEEEAPPAAGARQDGAQE